MTRRDPPLDMSWMDLAFDLAEAGRYTVSPNPMVGAVLVKGGRVVGKGFHRRAGGPHAEVVAMTQAGAGGPGAEPYVTPQPPAHTGRRPPPAGAVRRPGPPRPPAA